MLITVKTFNGHNINDGSSYRAVLQNQHTTPDATPIFIEETNSDSRDAGAYSVDVQNKVLSIKILNYGNRYDLISQLKTWLKRGTQGDLVVTFADEAVDYQISARVVNLVPENNSNQNWTALLQTGTSDWRAVTETTESTWTATGTTETLAINVGGKDETYLSLDLTPTAPPASGNAHQQIYRLPNTPGIAHGLIPWCITADTATLVTAGYMQADCDDLRIVNMNTGQELKRWIISPNNASTKIWVNLDLAKGFSLTLATAVAGSGSVTELQFSVTTDMKAAIAEMSKTGIVYHGTEWFAYSDTDPVNCKLIIATRGVFGTAQQAHSAGVSFLYIQYPLMMVYGNSSAVAPSSTDATYDDTKPFINLTSSSNTSWVFGGSPSTSKFFSKSLSQRTAAWTISKRSLGLLSDYFDEEFASVLGTTAAIAFMVKNFLSGGAWQPENVDFRATLYRAAGITSVTCTGYRHRHNPNWLDTAAVRASLDGVNYVDLFTEATPSTTGVSENWANNSTPATPATGSKYVQMVFAGGWPAAVKEWAVFEMLTCTLAFNSSNIPSGAFLGLADTAFPLVVTIKNETTGDQISINYSTPLDKVFSIDGENNLVQFDGYNAFGALSLDDEGRAVYLRLQGGVSNTIRITAADLGTLHIDLHWYRRRL